MAERMGLATAEAAWAFDAKSLERRSAIHECATAGGCGAAHSCGPLARPHLARRIAALAQCVPTGRLDRSRTNLGAIPSVLAHVSPHNAMEYRRAPLNALAMAERMHNVVERRCVFGYGAAKHSLRHYVVCPVAAATLAKYVVDFKARDRTPRSLLGLVPGPDAQRSDVAVGIMILYTVQCVARASGRDQWAGS